MKYVLFDYKLKYYNAHFQNTSLFKYQLNMLTSDLRARNRPFTFVPQFFKDKGLTK